MTTTETTSTSWFSRIGNSFKNILFGFLLIIIAVFLLFWNEGRAVKTEQSLTEGLSVVVSVSPDKKDPANNGKLVHFSGKAHVGDVLSDNEFGIRESALKMKRIVEVYQWKEKSTSKTTEKLGGGTETTTTYTYSKEWSDPLIDSSQFKEVASHENPTTKLFSDREWFAQDATVGAFLLSKDMIDSLGGYQTLPLTQGMLDIQSTTMPAQLKVADNMFYYQMADITKPEIGNMRIRYEFIAPQEISVVYKQSGGTLTPYTTKNGESISMITLGNHSAEEMFKNAQESNKMMTWILRIVGLFLLFIGFQLILGIVPVLGSIIPFVGSIVGAGVGIVSLLLALGIGCTVIGVAWLAYRPLIGIALIGIAIGSYVLLVKKVKRT